MRHRKRTFKIGRTSAHRRAMVGNAVCSLFLEKRIKTTVVKAKEIRRVAEKMITLGKNGSLHARRQAIAFMRQPDVVGHLFTEVAPRYENRDGGYTRIIRIGQRLGDAAEMCFLELVEELQPVVEEAQETAEPEASNETDENTVEEK